MKSAVLEKSKMYKVCNDIALKNEIVIFGSTYAANFPFYELSQKYFFNNAIYNRSIEGLTLDEADSILEDCVLNVKPSKIFISLGECDDVSQLTLKTYEDILLKIKSCLPGTQIYVMSVCGNNGFNKILENLCHKTDVKFIKINYNKSYEYVFKKLVCFFRKGNITYCEAFWVS